MQDEPWLMRVEGALEAHSSFVEGMTAATRADTTFLGRTVMHYLDDLLRSGWTPAQEREHVITITEPPPGSRPSPRRPWWRFWGYAGSERPRRAGHRI